MWTYKVIQTIVSGSLGLAPSTVLTGWIASGKRSLGLQVRRAPNAGQGRGTTLCPPAVMAEILKVLRAVRALGKI